MGEYTIPAILVLGIILAAILTRWANYFAFGQNMEKRYRKRERDQKSVRHAAPNQELGNEKTKNKGATYEDV